MSWQDHPVAGEGKEDKAPEEKGIHTQHPEVPPPDEPKKESEEPFQSKIIGYTPSMMGEPSLPIFEDPHDNKRILDLQGEVAKGGGRSFLQGATMGLSDKAGAAIEATLNREKDEDWSDAYHRHLQGYRHATEKFTEENPAASWGTWGVGSMLGLGKVKAALEGAGLMKAAPSLVGKALNEAKLGATVGGAAGFAGTNDESALEDVKATGVGAGLGAGIGAVAGAASDRIVNPILEWATRKLHPEAAKDQAIKAIAERAAADTKGGGPSAQDVMDLIDEHPDKPLALADVMGTNVKNFAGGLTREPGPASQEASRLLEARDETAGERLESDVNKHISPTVSVHKTGESLKELRSATATPFYEEGYRANPEIVSPEIDRILATPAGKKALAQARVDMQNDRKAMGRPSAELAELDEEGGPAAKGLNLQTLDYVRRALGDQVTALKPSNPNSARIIEGQKKSLTNELFKSDVTGKAPPDPKIVGKRVEGVMKDIQAHDAAEGNSDQLDKAMEILGDLRKTPNKPGAYKDLQEVKRLMDEHDAVEGNTTVLDGARGKLEGLSDKFTDRPEGGYYKRALDAYSGPSQSMDAMEEGRKIFSKHPDIIEHEMSELTPSDKEFYKIGAAEALRTKVAKMGMSADDSQAIIRTRYAQRQIKPLFDTEEAFEKFIKSAMAEHRMYETKASMLPKQKFENLETENKYGGAIKAVGGMLTGEPMMSGIGMAELAGKHLGPRKLSPEVAHEAVKMLFGSPDVRGILSRIAQRPRGAPTPLLRGPLTQVIGGAYPNLTTPSAQPPSSP